MFKNNFDYIKPNRDIFRVLSLKLIKEKKGKVQRRMEEIVTVSDKQKEDVA